MSAPIQKYIRGDSAVEIAESLETAIQDGRIAAGSPLPTVRGLARARGLSPTTVGAAYRALRGRGLLFVGVGLAIPILYVVLSSAPK